MKTVVNEFKIHNNIGFIVSTYNEDNVLVKRKEVVIITKSIKVKNKTYFMLFDDKGKLDEEHYDYVNRCCSNKSVGTREKISASICLLRKYAGIIDRELMVFTSDDFQRFYDFLTGNTNSSTYEFNTTYSKSTETAKTTINNCINFIKTKQLTNNELMKKINYNTFSKPSSYLNKQIRDCPKFISVSEMNEIHNYVINDNSLSKETRIKYDVIYRLMYVAGLRIGEVLGLTLEDFERKVDPLTGKYFYVIYVRNRLSDSKYQSAKRCMKITSKKTYKSRDYYRQNVGFQKVLIPELLYEDIMEYFDLMSQRLKKQGLEPAIADSVDSNQTNYYIFNNKKANTCLNKRELEAYTRNLYTRLGIIIDTKVKVNNLLHRFRHGFIMKLLYVDKLPSSEVIIYSRHSNEMCLQPYNNPTDEELSRILTDITEGVEYGITTNQTKSFK